MEENSIMMKGLVRYSIGWRGRTCLGNLEVIRNHLPNHKADAEFMETVKKDGNSM